jgi:hypothetical protein
MPRLEAYILNERARRGDREAIATFRSLWPPDTACFVCDEPVGARTTTLLLPDPDDPANRALLAPECPRCAGARRHDQTVRAMLAAMWPARRVRIEPRL